MQTLSQIRTLLAERGLHPKHRLGQNFLHDKNQLTRLVTAAGVRTGEVVLEVGPGTGTLTEALLDAGAEVVACELDRDMASIIEDRLGDRLVLIRGDCMERPEPGINRAIIDALAGRPFKLVANLPYGVASTLMVGLLMNRDLGCRGQWVTIQKEVADRLLAPPGGKSYGPLGIIVQALGEVSRIGTVPAACFWPAPEVTSVMVAIRPLAEPRVAEPHAFARFITTLFSFRRKQLGTTFGRHGPWPSGVVAEQRPETLTNDQLAELHRLRGETGD